MTAEKMAIAAVGEDARPSGHIRLAQSREDGRVRFQQRWDGHFGRIWLDVPWVKVDRLSSNREFEPE